MSSGWNGATTVWMASRSLGGVSITDKSRRPNNDMCSVRGMGVALMATASTPLQISLSRSLCLTPKRCSSSMMTSPRSFHSTSFEKSRCVPTTRSTLPSAMSTSTALISFAVRKRLNISIRPPDLVREKPMRADHQINFALGNVDQHRLDLFRRTKAAQHLDTHGKWLKPLLERLGMLEGQHRRGGQHRDLFAIPHGF